YLSSRFTATGTLTADVARSDSLGTLTRTIGPGLRVRVAGALELVVDSGLGLNDQSPRWMLSAGLGTAFSGLSPVGLNNPVERVKQTFGRGSAKARGLNVKKGTN